MVKVYICHNFKSQSVVPVDGEPVTIYTHQEKVFVATQHCTIEVFTLDKQEQSGSKYIKLNSFYTEAPVLQLLYSPNGDYIATIECKQSRKASYYSVKVYLNWKNSTDEQRQLAHVRLSGENLGLKLQNPDVNRLEVIDIPFKTEVSGITTCVKTGNLAIACEDVTQVYHLVEKTLLHSDKTYLDVVLFLQLHWSFIVERISICEDFISVLSDKEAQVVRVIYLDKVTGKQTQHEESDSRPARSVSTESFRIAHRKTSTSILNPSLTEIDLSTSSKHSKLNVGSRESTTPSPALSNSSFTKSLSDTFNCILDDDNFVQWKFDDLDLGSDIMMSHLSNKRPSRFKEKKTTVLRGLHEMSCRDLLLADPPKVEDHRGGGHMTIGDVKVINLLYKRIDAQDLSGGWKHLQLIPTYLSKNERFGVPDGVGSTPLHSSSFSEMVGMCCMLSGSTTGYMYSIWPQNLLLSQYKYTAEAKQVIAEGDLLYVLTGSGLEIYTTRYTAIAIHDMEQFSGTGKAFPSVKQDICLCGIHPFIGAREVTVTDKRVVLLAMIEATNRSDESVWSLYSLEKFSVTELYKEMVALGSRHQKNNPDTYIHLLEEGHMILQCSLLGSDAKDPSTKDLLEESAALLGEYYATPGKGQWQLSLAYFLMSGLDIADVVRSTLEYKHHTKQTTPYCYGQGFLHYLNYVLFQDEEPFKLKEEDADMILEVCAEAMPQKLSRIVLFSRIHSYNPEKTLKLVNNWLQQKSNMDEVKSGTDFLALAILHLKLCDPESAQASLASVHQKELLQLCVNHQQLLHDDFQQLSPLSQLMRRHCPSVLISCMVALHDIGTIPLDLAIKLFQGTVDQEQIHKNAHLKDYLESLINDEQRRYVFEDAVSLLCGIYIKRLQEWKPQTSRQLVNQKQQHLPRGDGHFGQRYTWLDDLPPLAGTQSLKQPCMYTIVALPSSARGSKMSANKPIKPMKPSAKGQEECPCFLCHEDLLKLQSLLCSSYTTLTLADRVLSLLEGQHGLPGFDSLWLLCMLVKDRDKATQLTIEKFPEILTDYGVSVMGKDYSQWRFFFDCLMVALRGQTTSADDRQTSYLQALHGILSWLSGVLEPEKFLSLLPDDGSFSFFFPYISKCYEAQLSHRLFRQIVNKGEKLRQSSS